MGAPARGLSKRKGVRELSRKEIDILKFRGLKVE